MNSEIDLHGVKHEEVSRVLDSFLWEHMQKKSVGIKIITGNSSEMRKIVDGVLNEYGLVGIENFCNPATMYVSLV